MGGQAPNKTVSVEKVVNMVRAKGHERNNCLKKGCKRATCLEKTQENQLSAKMFPLTRVTTALGKVARWTIVPKKTQDNQLSAKRVPPSTEIGK